MSMDIWMYVLSWELCIGSGKSDSDTALFLLADNEEILPAADTDCLSLEAGTVQQKELGRNINMRIGLYDLTHDIVL
jgi:hypothetical protein